MNSIGNISPAAFTILHLIRAHQERAEHISERLLAKDMHMTTTDIRTALRELSEWPERDLVA
ncbi:hypothetical protein ACFUT3_33985 [Streptomyces cinereoruber]|uniref:hypothetical protein n=1 Tax=Streptomyces cinereoruber TaxID=67260 RepID=UPI00363B1CCF